VPFVALSKIADLAPPVVAEHAFIGHKAGQRVFTDLFPDKAVRVTALVRARARARRVRIGVADEVKKFWAAPAGRSIGHRARAEWPSATHLPAE
jgi:hypothetical protein